MNECFLRCFPPEFHGFLCFSFLALASCFSSSCSPKHFCLLKFRFISRFFFFQALQRCDFCMLLGVGRLSRAQTGECRLKRLNYFKMKFRSFHSPQIAACLACAPYSIYVIITYQRYISLFLSLSDEFAFKCYHRTELTFASCFLPSFFRNCSQRSWFSFNPIRIIIIFLFD